jgi:hypothetical protein
VDRDLEIGALGFGKGALEVFDRLVETLGGDAPHLSLQSSSGFEYVPHVIQSIGPVGQVNAPVIDGTIGPNRRGGCSIA